MICVRVASRFRRRNALGSRVTLSSAFGSDVGRCETYYQGYLLPCRGASLGSSRGIIRHYTPGTSLKYANTQLSGRPSRFLGRPVSLHVCMRRNVYDHGEIKSTAKILPLIRMWSLLPPSLHRPRLSSLDPSKASPLPFPLYDRAVARKTKTDDTR